LDSKLEDRRFYMKWYQALPDFNPLLTSALSHYSCLN
jgi:hypothetical protein